MVWAVIALLVGAGGVAVYLAHGIEGLPPTVRKSEDDEPSKERQLEDVVKQLGDEVASLQRVFAENDDQGRNLALGLRVELSEFVRQTERGLGDVRRRVTALENSVRDAVGEVQILRTAADLGEITLAAELAMVARSTEPDTANTSSGPDQEEDAPRPRMELPMHGDW